MAWDDVAHDHERGTGSAFYREALREKSVWTIRDVGGYPAPLTASGRRAQPFWSLRSRAERILSGVPASRGFLPEEVPLDAFRRELLPDLERHALLVGLNWSGPCTTGYDLTAPDLKRNLAAIESTGTGSA